MTDRRFVSAIVLAAGESRRMGTPKLVLPLGGSTILERSVEHLLAGGAAEVIVVLGRYATELRAKVHSPARAVVNEDYRLGMGSSISAGVSAADPRADGILIALGDQPFIPPDVIRALLRAFRSTGKGIVAPVCRGRRGHPTIFDATYRAQLISLGTGGARALLQAQAADILELPTQSDTVLRDIDTPADIPPSG